MIRLALSYPQQHLERRAVLRPDHDAVTRLVFVCHGNICRSAFADVVARRLGLRTASFGLSTSSGKPAHGPAIDAARLLGHDLATHRTTRAEDYAPEPGDLLLAMEVRQLVRLSHDPRLAGMPRMLLGSWAHPPYPHLHDPYRLSPAYMATCLRRIESAVLNLADAFPGARPS